MQLVVGVCSLGRTSNTSLCRVAGAHAVHAAHAVPAVQDDLMYATLTVQETLYFAAMLRLPKHKTKAEKVRAGVGGRGGVGTLCSVCQHCCRHILCLYAYDCQRAVLCAVPRCAVLCCCSWPAWTR